MHRSRFLDAGHYDLMGYLLKYMPRFDEMVMRNLPAGIEEDEKRAIAVFTEYGAVRLLKRVDHGGMLEIATG